LAHQWRLADDAVADVARGLACRLLLLDDSAQSLVLRAGVEKRGERVARIGRPHVDAVDEQQLAIAAYRPIGFGRSQDAIEIDAGERRERSDLLPLTETVARGEAPADRTEIATGERERADGRVAQHAQFSRRVGCGRAA